MSSDNHDNLTGPTTVPFVEPADRAPIGLSVQGRYRIVGELGTGAFGTVYLAEQETTGHRVAIRLLPRGFVGAPHAVEAIRRMSRSIVDASTAHPGLVRVREFGEAETGRPFVAMEFVEGRRLSEILSEGEVDMGAALRLSLDLGGAVEALHNLGLIHGALRPCNVMVLEDGRVKLMDVELAGLRDAPVMEGVITAKPPAEYLSPEQIRQAPVTEKTDIYAFAVILYELLCGVPPFRAATSEAVLAQHLTETPIRMSLRRPAVPVAVERIVRRALDKQPESRPFMPDVLNRLWAEANTPATRWQRTAAVVGGAAVAVSIAVLVAWSMFAPRPSALRSLAQSASRLAAEQAQVNASPTSSALATAKRVAPMAGPATPSVQPSAASPAAENRAYWIQVGAFKDHEAAKRLAGRLRQQNYRVEESPARADERETVGGAPSASSPSRGSASDEYDVFVGGGDVLHRVRVGPYADRAAATSALKALEGKGYKPFITKRREAS